MGKHKLKVGGRCPSVGKHLRAEKTHMQNIGQVPPSRNDPLAQKRANAAEKKNDLAQAWARMK
jgi:hypothetical protein